MSEDDVTLAADTAASAPAPEPATAPREDELWETYYWNGFRGYRCRRCQWDVLELDILDDGEAIRRQHAAQHLPPPPKVQLIRTPLIDRFGNPIVRLEEE